MRNKFDEQLALLNREMISMGALCEEAIAVTARSMLDGEEANSIERVRSLENDIDQKERDIESICLKLLLQQQPVASDLRQISAALKMITDMERIGDQALDIAETATFMGPVAGAAAPLRRDRARKANSRVPARVDPSARHDAEAAGVVAAKDDEADELFTRIKKSIIERISTHSGEGEYALDLLMIAKYLERIGDHATNIAEWVEFSVTGVHKGGEML